MHQQEGYQEDEFYESIEQQFLDACRHNEQKSLEQLLLETGLDFLYVNNQNNNCLHMAAANGHLQVMETLLKEIDRRGIKQKSILIDKQNSDGNTPLHYAVISRQQPAVELLLAQGANPNLKNESQRTPLKEAAQFSTSQIAQILAKVTEIDPEDLLVEEEAQMQSGNEKIQEQDIEENGFEGQDVQQYDLNNQEIGEQQADKLQQEDQEQLKNQNP